MRTTGSRISATLACAMVIAALAGRPVPMQAAAGDAKYHTYQELTAELKAVAAAQPDLARVASIGKTREGRDIWAVEIASRAGTPRGPRPALLVAANFEGDHVIGSELALLPADFLLASYATDAAVKQRLDTSVIYIVPRVNADGAELMFAPVKALRRTNATPFDADNDGRMDEDGPEDLNKDGVITVMRVKDPKGPYMVSPDDPRLMKRADPAKGESGGWALYREGIDNDGDGFINEDGPGGVEHQPQLHARLPVLRSRRRPLHGQRGRDARDARVHAQAPQHRGDPHVRRKRQPDHRRPHAPTRPSTWSTSRSAASPTRAGSGCSLILAARPRRSRRRGRHVRGADEGGRGGAAAQPAGRAGGGRS